MLRARQKVNYVSAESLAVCKCDSFDTLSVSQLLKIAKNISAGMAYLHLKV